MLRALSTHVKDGAAAGGGGGLTITYFVYTSRLLFELIADPAISGMMKSLEPVAHVGFVFIAFSLLSLSLFSLGVLIFVRPDLGRLIES